MHQACTNEVLVTESYQLIFLSRFIKKILSKDEVNITQYILSEKSWAENGPDIFKGTNPTCVLRVTQKNHDKSYPKRKDNQFKFIFLLKPCEVKLVTSCTKADKSLGKRVRIQLTSRLLFYNNRGLTTNILNVNLGNSSNTITRKAHASSGHMQFSHVFGHLCIMITHIRGHFLRNVQVAYFLVTEHEKLNTAFMFPEVLRDALWNHVSVGELISQVRHNLH